MSFSRVEWDNIMRKIVGRLLLWFIAPVWRERRAGHDSMPWEERVFRIDPWVEWPERGHLQGDLYTLVP